MIKKECYTLNKDLQLLYVKIVGKNEDILTNCANNSKLELLHFESLKKKLRTECK